MKEIDQMQKSAKNVSRTWMTLRSKQIERLAIQYGRNAENAAFVAEEACRRIYFEETFTQHEDELLLTLYQIAILFLQENEEVEDSNLLPFVEDQELHQFIIQLNSQIKSPFILSEFHEFNKDEISKILGKSATDIYNSIGEAHLLLGKRIGTTVLNKRLNFLQKSYDRIQSNLNIEHVFQKRQIPSIENTNVQSKSPKKTILIWIAGIFGILTLCIVTIVSSEEFQQAFAEKYIEGLRESFESELSSKLNELGIPDLSIEEQNKYRFSYIFIARDQFDDFIGMLNQNKDQIQSNKKEIQKQYQDILLSLQFPSDMVTSLLENPLTHDLELSEAFINQFFLQHDVIRELYLMKMHSNYQYFLTEIVDNQLDFQKILAKKDTFPFEFQELFEGMSKQNFEIISMANFYPSFQKSEFSKKMRQSLHENVGGYITLLESEPFYLHPNLVHSLEDTVNFIRDFEKALLTTNPQETVLNYGSPYFYLSNTYHELLYQTVIGSNAEKVFGPDGIVKDEVQTAWKAIASFDENSPSAFIMREIVNEMEANQWKESKKYTQVFYGDHFRRAFEMARSGNLNDFAWEPYNESGNMTVFLDDLSFNKVVKELYREFSFEHDLTLLRNALPLQIFGMYELANQLEDPVTMWHLLDHSNIPFSLEEFVEGWKQYTLIADVAVRLFVEDLGEMFNDSPILSLGYQNENTTTYFGRLISDEENSVWLIYDVSILR